MPRKDLKSALRKQIRDELSQLGVNVCRCSIDRYIRNNDATASDAVEYFTHKKELRHKIRKLMETERVSDISIILGVSPQLVLYHIREIKR